MTTDTLTREINPEFESIGKRRRMVGVRAIIRDGETVIYNRVHSTYSQAEIACDAYVFEALEDLSACGGFGCVDGCSDCAIEVAA